MALKHAEPVPALAVDAGSGWLSGPGGWDRSELKRRIWFTLGALAVYRIGNYVPIPGLSPWVLEDAFWWRHADIIHAFDSGPLLRPYGGPFNFINIFSAHATERMSIFALSVMPYIWALIIMQLMTAMFPTLGQLNKAGKSGRLNINQYTRYLTVALAGFQAYGLAVWLEAPGGWPSSLIADPGYLFRASTVFTVAGGTMFLMWLGEQITARGIGNGISLIIFAGIVANLPAALANTLDLVLIGALPVWLVISLLLLVLAVTGLIVFVERARRRIVVQYPKRPAGHRMSGGNSSQISLKLNTAGVIAPIVVSLLLMPLTVFGFGYRGEPEWMQPVIQLLGRGQPLYLILFTALIVFFCFFYSAIGFDSPNTAGNLKKYGGFVAGMRPGKNTADYLDYMLTRLTLIGAIYLAAVFILPEHLFANYPALPFTVGGINQLIIVLVTMETIALSRLHPATTERG